MKAVSPVGPTEPGAVPPVDLGTPVMCPERLGSVDGVGIAEPLQDSAGIDGLGPVQRDAELLAGPEVLKGVHPVRHTRLVVGPHGQVVIPAGPGQRLAREEALVGVQDDLALQVGNAPQNFPLLRAGITQQL